jgi:hypothetical protein
MTVPSAYSSCFGVPFNVFTAFKCLDHSTQGHFLRSGRLVQGVSSSVQPAESKLVERPKKLDFSVPCRWKGFSRGTRMAHITS